MEVMLRRFNRMEREFQLLHSLGIVSTTSPKRMTVDDISAYYEYLKTKAGRGSPNISIDSIKKDLIDLDKLCSFEENNCVSIFKKKCPALSKGQSSARLPVFTDEEFDSIVRHSNDVELTDGAMIRAYALIALYLGAGLRTVEAVNARADQIRFGDGVATIHLTVVKGRDSYGQPRDAYIIPRFIPIIEKYLAWRRSYLEFNGRDCEYMFFSLDGFEMLSDKTIRQIRNKAEEDLGIRFDGRKCRRSYGQYLLDHNVDLEVVSSLMGHSTTKTTEEYYARIRSHMAIRRAQKQFVLE